MKKEYEDMKKQIEEYNNNLPKYNSEDFPKVLPEFCERALYESVIDKAEIDDYDTFINKMVTASDFDYETEWRNMLSLGADFIPGIVRLKMVLEGAEGQDLITGRHLSPEEQLMI